MSERAPGKPPAVLAAVDLFGAAVAVSLCLGEFIFFCAYLVAVPFLALMAVLEIPRRLGRHVR